MDVLERDTGAQLERTILSWHRSGLAIAANGALLARGGFDHGRSAIWVVGLLVVLVGVAAGCGVGARRVGVAGAAVFVAALSVIDMTQMW